MVLRAPAALALAGLVLFVPPPARTQDATWDASAAAALTGRWSLVGTEDDARATVDAAIAAAVADLPPLVSSLAANQLRERLVVSSTVELVVTPERIESRFVHATFGTVPGVPATVPVPGHAGETMELVQVLRTGRLEQVFTTDGGRRWSTFTASGSTLTLDVVVRSDRLGSDVRYRLGYRRAG